MIPTMMKKFRVNNASRTAAEWLGHTLNREGKYFGTSVLSKEDNVLELRW